MSQENEFAKGQQITGSLSEIMRGIDISHMSQDDLEKMILEKTLKREIDPFHFEEIGVIVEVDLKNDKFTAEVL